MKKIKIEQLQKITGGDRCDRLEKKHKSSTGKRKERVYIKALYLGCAWS